MTTPQVLVLAGYGINCEEETAYAFRTVGAKTEIVHINDLIDGQKKLENYQIFCIPGGFAHGDETGAGKAMANKIYNNLREAVLTFLRRDTLSLSICNGFQIATALGLVPALDEKYGERQAALMANTNARYNCRWVYIRNVSQKCVFTKGIDMIYAPIAHGEGNFYMEKEGLKKLQENDQIVFTYVREDGSAANEEYPYNPNGSILDIAAICDPTGRVMAMMPHPERGIFFYNRPDFTLEKEKLRRAGKTLPKFNGGMKIFENAVEYFG